MRQRQNYFVFNKPADYRRGWGDNIHCLGGTIRAENRPQGGLRMVLRIPQTEGEMDHETHSDR